VAVMSKSRSPDRSDGNKVTPPLDGGKTGRIRSGCQVTAPPIDNLVYICYSINVWICQSGTIRSLKSGIFSRYFFRERAADIPGFLRVCRDRSLLISCRNSKNSKRWVGRESAGYHIFIRKKLSKSNH
jgi:hypothetical protein